MKRTNWTQQRLERLFQRYDRRFWKGRLSNYSVHIENLASNEYVGLCKPLTREILVDIAAHSSDREIRETLLHEMAHAADDSKSRRAHGDGFFAEIEHLLEQGAPIGLNMPEMPDHIFPLSAVPKKFPLCRQAAAKLEAKRVSEIKRLQRKHKGTIMTQDVAGAILLAFADDTMHLTWRLAKELVGKRYGLIDCEGRPADAKASKILAQGKRLHSLARRDYLAEKKTMEAWEMVKPLSKSGHSRDPCR